MMRPEILLKAAMSLDGFTDDCSEERLVLSSPEDQAAVDCLRAECDAILVGAGTLRSDDPRLVIKSQKLIRERQGRGVPANPVKVTVTASGDLPLQAKFFSLGEDDKIVYCSRLAARALPADLPASVLVKAMGDDRVCLEEMLADMSSRDIKRLVVEGGVQLRREFLAAGLVDQLRLAVAPFFLGKAGAAGLLGTADMAWSREMQLKLQKVENFGQTAVLWYKGQARSLPLP